MKRTFQSLLLVWALTMSLVPMQVMRELEKVPALMDHYLTTHRVEQPEQSFWEFLAEHYAANNTRQNPAHNHGKLPMFSCACGVTAQVPTALELSAPRQDEPASRVSQLRCTPSRLSVADIFQPPRLG